jgi:predicted DNA-binding transcriptional regulator AlpA
MNAGKPLLMIESAKHRPTFRGLLTDVQVARSIGVSVDELHAMTTAGTGPVGFALTRRVLRYAPVDVDAWKGQRVA